MDLEQGFRLEDLTRMLRRRAWLIGTAAGAVFLLSVFVAAILPNVYQSTATMLIEPQTISEDLVESGVPERNVNSRLHLLQMQILSRGRLSRVIDDLGLYEEESQEMTREEVIEMMRSQIRLEPVLPELEEAMMDRRSQIQINTFQLIFRHEDRATAAAVANRLAGDFIDEHIRERVEISGSTSEFIQAKLSELTEQIAAVEDRIAQVKSENTGKLPEDMATNQRVLERTLDSIREAERQLDVARSDAGFFRQQAAVGGGPESPDTPARRLQMAEVEMAQLKARGFTEKHPDVIAIRGEIESLEQQIAGQDEEGEAPMTLAAAEAQRAELRVRSAQEELARLREQADRIEARLAATPRVQEQLASLERRWNHLRDSYQDFSQKQLSAGVAADMERRQKGEQFRVLEAAYPAPDPVSPNRPLIMVMGLLLGLALGGGAAVAMEAADSSFHSARGVQESFGLPVLAQVPVVLLESDRVRMRRRNLMRFAAAGVFATVVLTASVLGNWWVNGMPGPVQELFGGGAEATAPASPGRS